MSSDQKFLGQKDKNCAKNEAEPISENIFEIWEKDVLVNYFGNTGQIQLILVTLDQKLGELTNKYFNCPKKKHRKFFKLFLAKLPICEGRPFAFCNFFKKAFIPLPKGSNG